MEFSKKGRKVWNKFNSKRRELLLAPVRVSWAKVRGPSGGARLPNLLSQGRGKEKELNSKGREF